MIGRGFLAALVLAMAGAFGSADGATPRAEDVAVCTFARQVQFSNPLTQRPTHGVLRSPKRGAIECDGTIAGQPVGGLGRIKLSGVYGDADEVYFRGGDTCALGSGSIFFTAYVPQLMSRPQRFIRVRGAYSYRRVGLDWRGTGIARDHMSRRLIVDALARHRGDGRQDCFNRPLASALLQGRIVIRTQQGGQE